MQSSDESSRAHTLAMVERYALSMSEIKTRLQFMYLFGEGFIRTKNPPGIKGTMFDLMLFEGMALQMRQVLELMAFSSLIASQAPIDDFRSSFGSMRKVKKVLAELAKIRPNFFPERVTIDRVEHGPTPEAPRKFHISAVGSPDIFGVDEFAQLFDDCSQICHTMNPLDNLEPVVLKRTFLESIERIRNLLQFHRVSLGSKGLFLVNMHEWEHDLVTVTPGFA